MQMKIRLAVTFCLFYVMKISGHCDTALLSTYETLGSKLHPAISLHDKNCKCDLTATEQRPDADLLKSLAWVIFSNSASAPIMNLTLQTYLQYAHQSESGLSLSMYVCVDKAMTQWPNWVNQIYYRQAQDKNWMSKALECVAQVHHAFILFMMDDWLLTAIPNYSWFAHVIEIMREQSDVNFVTFDSTLQFGGITTPWNGLVFSPAAALTATLWRSSSLLASLHATASMDLTGNPRMASPAMYESPGLLSPRNRLTHALDVTYGKGHWEENFNSAENRPWHWPGLEPATLTRGSAALSWVHAISSGYFRSSPDLCTLFDSLGAWDSIETSMTFMNVSRYGGIVPDHYTSPITPNFQRYCKKLRKEFENEFRPMPLSIWHCSGLTSHDAMRIQAAIYEFRFKKLMHHSTEGHVPPHCTPHWTGIPGSIRMFLPSEVKELGGTLKEVATYLERHFDKLGVAPPCCFDVRSRWRMEKTGMYSVCAPSLESNGLNRTIIM